MMSGNEEFEEVATDAQQEQLKTEEAPADAAAAASENVQGEPLNAANKEAAVGEDAAPKPMWKLWMNAAAKTVSDGVETLNQNETVQRVVKATNETIAPVKEAAAPVWERTVATVTPAWETTKEGAKTAFDATKEASIIAVEKTKIAAAEASEAAAPAMRRASATAAEGWTNIVAAASTAAEKASTTLNEAIQQQRRGSSSGSGVSGDAHGETWQDSANSAEADRVGTPEPEQGGGSEAPSNVDGSRDPASPTFVSEPPATVFTSAANRAKEATQESEEDVQ